MSGGFPEGTLARTALGQLMATEKTLDGSTLGRPLLELVRLHVSQSNGCAYCIAMHRAALAETGETAERMADLPDWENSSLFTPRERAALLWAETLTALPDDASLPAPVTAAFDADEQGELALAISMINMWNRLMTGWDMAPAG